MVSIVNFNHNLKHSSTNTSIIDRICRSVRTLNRSFQENIADPATILDHDTQAAIFLLSLGQRFSWLIESVNHEDQDRDADYGSNDVFKKKDR